MSPSKKIALVCALVMLLRFWLPCAIWLLPLSIVMVLLRLLLPDVLSALTLSVPALGFSIHKRPSSTRFTSKEDAHPILTAPLWLLPARDSIHRASLASLCFLASPRSPSAFLCFPFALPFSGFFLTLLCPPRIHKPCPSPNDPLYFPKLSGILGNMVSVQITPILFLTCN